MSIALERNEENNISEGFMTNGPIRKCEVASINYDGRMRAGDFISFDNVSEGQTLTTGKNDIIGNAKEDCSISFNGVPLQIGEDKKFSVIVDIAEGSNTLDFEVELGGEQDTKTISVNGELPADQYKASCPPGPPYPNINKNPDSYAGTRCQYKGEAIQVMESSGKTDIRMDITPMSYGYWKDTIYVNYNGTTPTVEGNIIIVYGEVKGSYTYTSVAGYEITLPLIEAKYIDVVQ